MYCQKLSMCILLKEILFKIIAFITAKLPYESDMSTESVYFLKPKYKTVIGILFQFIATSQTILKISSL